MGIFLYESTLSPFHISKNPNYSEEDEIYDEDYEYYEDSSIRHASIDKNSPDYTTSYKYIELHNCEIDYDSIMLYLLSFRTNQYLNIVVDTI